MTLTKHIVKRIIKRLLNAEDYRHEVVTLIDAAFLQFAIDFFKKVVNAKLSNQSITSDWYKAEFLNPTLPPQDIAIHSGLNKKTIHNMHNSSTREIVISAANEHYALLHESIERLIESESELELTLTIKLQGVSVELSISESLIVINTLAVKRAELRGGLWSSAGKRVEKPLMQTLCKLYKVPAANYAARIGETIVADDDFSREVDFYLIGSESYKCEVKLMGRGNPESADAVIARSSKIFVADKLSDTNKAQLDSLHVQWVELNDDFRKFGAVLANLQIPHTALPTRIDSKIEQALQEILGE